MHHIPDERKQAILLKMLSPDAPSIANMAKQEGISEATLYNWRTKLRQQGRPVPTPERNSTNWTAQTKFAIIVETASMHEAELAQYCRLCAKRSSGRTGRAAKDDPVVSEKNQRITAGSRP